jgi:uncharacterized protein YcbK (DUF882 family)
MSEPDFHKYRNFARYEFVCPCGCERADMDDRFMDRLQALRDAFGAPLVVSSGYRCSDHNDEVSSTGRDGPHTRGRAADITIHGDDAYDLLALVERHGFTGIGLAQKGDHSGRFIHLDDLNDPDDLGFSYGPRPWVWTY